MARSYGLDLYGDFKIDSESTISGVALEERRIVYVTDEDKLYIGTGSDYRDFSGSTRKHVSFYYEGVCQDEGLVVDGFYFDNDVVVDKITMYARVAPAGSDLTVQLLKDGAEESGKVATLTDSLSYERTDITDDEYTTLERFGLRIKSIGSSESGQGLTVIVHYYDKL